MNTASFTYSILRSCFNTFPQGNFDDVLATVAALHKAGVDMLTGTDVSVPISHLGGLAHGASVHHELQLLVAAGLTPVEARGVGILKQSRPRSLPYSFRPPEPSHW